MTLKHEQELKRFENHKEFFKIENSVFLDEFKNFLKKSDNVDYRLECSVKINGDKIFPSRFNVYFEDSNHLNNLKKIFSFFDSLSALGASFDYNLLGLFINDDLDLNKIQQIICGIDLRNTMEESRAKIWFLLKEDATDLINKAVSFFNYQDPKFFNLYSSSKLLVGFDFGFKQRSKIKMYLPFVRSQLVDLVILAKLQDSLSDKAFKFINLSDQIYVLFDQSSNIRTLNFLIKNPLDLFKLIKKSLNDDLITFLKDKTHIYLSLSEEDILKEDYTKINLYYGL